MVKTTYGFYRRGLLIERIINPVINTSLNKVFKVSWQDGTTTTNVWDYDLEVISESR